MTLNTPNINQSITTDISVNADAKHSVTPTGSFSSIETQAGVKLDKYVLAEDNNHPILREAQAKAFTKYGDILTGSFNIIGSNAGIKLAKYELVGSDHTILSKAQVNAFALHGEPNNLVTYISAIAQIKSPQLNNMDTENVSNIITKIGGVQHYMLLETPFVYPSITAAANTDVYFKEASVPTTTDIISVKSGIYIPIGRYNTMQVEAWYSPLNNPTIDKRVLGYYNGEYVFGIRLRKFIGTDIINEISTIAHVTAEKGSMMPQVEQIITEHGNGIGIYRGNTDVVITKDTTIIAKVGILAIVRDFDFDEPGITIDALSEVNAHAKHGLTNNFVDTLSVVHNLNYKHGGDNTVGHNEYISSSSAGVRLAPYKLVESIQEIIDSNAHVDGHAIAHEVPETHHIINSLLFNANALVFANDIHTVVQNITTAMEIIVMEDRPTEDVLNIINAAADTYPIVFNSAVEALEVLEVSSFDAGVYNPKDEELPDTLEQLDTLHGLEVLYDGKAVREKINYVEISDSGYNVIQIALETTDKTDLLNALVDASIYHSGRVIFNLDQTSIHKGDSSYLVIIGDNLETNEQVISITSDGFSDALYNGKVVDELYELNIGTQTGVDYVYGLDTYVARTDLIHSGESGVSLYHTGRVTLDYIDSITHSGGLLKPVFIDHYIDNSENTIMSSANSEQVVGDMLNTTESINSITKQFGLSVDYNGKVTQPLSDSVIYAVGALGQLYMNYGTTEHTEYLTADANVPHINNPTHYDISEIIQNILNVSSYDTTVYFNGRVAMGDLEDNIVGTSNATAVERNYSIVGIVQNISKSTDTSLNFNGKVVVDDIQHTITIDHGVEYYRIVPTEAVSETINAACGLGNIIYDAKETEALTNNISISATAANTHTKHVSVESNLDVLLALMDVIVQYNGKVPLPNIDNITVQHELQHAYGRDAYSDQTENDIYATANGLSIVGAAKTATATHHSAVATANTSAYYTGRVTGASTHSIGVQYGTDYVYGPDTYVARTDNIMVSADAKMFRGGANTDNTLQNILALANTKVSYRAYNASATNAINLINSGYATGVIKDSYTTAITHSITGNSNVSTLKNTPTHNVLNTVTASSNASAYYTGRVSLLVSNSVNVSNFGYVTGPIKNSTTTNATHTITSNIGINITKHLLTENTIQSMTKVANALARVKNSTTSSATHTITKIADTTVTYRGANRSYVFYPMMWDNGSNYQAGQVNALLGDVWHDNNGTLTKVATQTHYWQGSIVDNALFSIRNVTLAEGIEYASKDYTTPHNSLTLVTDNYPTNWTLQGIPSNTNERQARIIYRGKVYNVNFNNNGGIGSTSIQYRVNPTAAYSISLSAHIPTRTGYTFTGWTITSGPGTISGNSISMPQWTASNNAYGDINVKANWNINTYSITRTLGTGVTAATISPASYNVTTATFTPTLSGITYSRGYSSYSVSPTITSIPTGSTGNKNYTITASKISYTINIDENGGGSVSNPSNYVINPSSAQTKTFTAPTRTNYSIVSWTVTGHNGTIPTVSGTSGTVTLTIPADTIGNLTITANWAYTGPYSITMSMGDSTGGYITPTYYEQNYNQSLNITNPTRPGYTLTGYAFVVNYPNATITKPSSTYLLNIPANGTGDIVFAPTWSSNSYTITRGTNSSYVTLSSHSYSTSTSSQTITISYSRTGYNFSSATITRTGTYGGPTPTVSGTTITIPAGSYGTFTVNVNASPKTYTITLNKQSGTGGTSSIAGVYGSSLTPTSVSVPTRTNYTFQGYYTATSGGTQRINASGTYVALTSTTYSSNVTLYARWQAAPSKTATPTVGTPACSGDSGGYNYLKATVKNNDTSSVTIKRNGSTIGTVAAGATVTMTLVSGFSTPYSYNLSITATASGKSESDAVSKSGNVLLCIMDF